MVIYLVVFILISFLAFLIEKSANKKINKFWIILIIFILSLMGGIRNHNIGTDINVYGKPWFQTATTCDKFIEYTGKIETSDIGYLLFNYLISRFTSELNVYLFIHQLVCNTLVITTLYKYKKENKDFSFLLALSMYYFIYYFRTYNLLRQSISLSILFFATNYLMKNRYILYILCVLIAAQFHFTAYFGLILLILYTVIASNIKRKGILIFFIVFISILICLNAINIMKILYNIGLINERVYSYSTIFLKEKANINLIESLYKLIFIFMVFLVYKDVLKNKYALFLFSILDFISFQLSSIMSYTDRIALYFGYVRMLLIPDILDRKNYKNRFIFEIIIICLLFSFWIYKFIINGSCEIYPYENIFFNI